MGKLSIASRLNNIIKKSYKDRIKISLYDLFLGHNYLFSFNFVS